MRKKIFLVALICFLPLAISACSNSKQLSQNANQKNNDNSLPNNFRRPDFGEPEKEADVRGVVKSVTGNEVVILKMEMGAGKSLNGTSTGTVSNEAIQSPAVSLTGGAIPSQGGRMMAGGPGGFREDDNRASLVEALKEMSSGEETIFIPVGIRMLKLDNNSDSGKKEMVEATLEDVKADKMITVWFNESISDRQVAEFVVIN